MTGYVVEQNGKIMGVGEDPVGAVRCAMDNGACWDIDSAPLTVKAVDDETYCRLRFGGEDAAPRCGTCGGRGVVFSSTGLSGTACPDCYRRAAAVRTCGACSGRGYAINELGDRTHACDYCRGTGRASHDEVKP